MSNLYLLLYPLFWIATVTLTIIGIAATCSYSWLLAIALLIFASPALPIIGLISLF